MFWKLLFLPRDRWDDSDQSHICLLNIKLQLHSAELNSAFKPTNSHPVSLWGKEKGANSSFRFTTCSICVCYEMWDRSSGLTFSNMHIVKLFFWAHWISFFNYCMCRRLVSKWHARRPIVPDINILSWSVWLFRFHRSVTKKIMTG